MLEQHKWREGREIERGSLTCLVVQAEVHKQQLFVLKVAEVTERQV